MRNGFIMDYLDHRINKTYSNYIITNKNGLTVASAETLNQAKSIIERITKKHSYIIESNLIDKYLYKNIPVKKACFLALQKKNINVDIYSIKDIKSFKYTYHIIIEK